ncbi:FtsX-like permease family protein [Pedobacter sp. HMF7647]|uniref:FtsX-like permease family protein n=1 Tax=Hufsiella arboris TaxID=2695275 RepID=A0A7K1YBS3_9SPHI|nr:ABC transporter permease [Hufsiella arboris]MXV51478.1 FtsX-like permease family protein [Hufsiella arboris]
MLKNYFQTAWRNIIKHKATSFINIFGLSVGMTAAVLIFLWAQNERNFDSQPDQKQIYRLTTRVPSIGWVWESTPLLLAEAIRTELPDVQKTARLNTNNLPVVSLKGNLFYGKDYAYVDDDWFSMFNYRFIAGSTTAFNANPFSIILTKSEARRFFADANPVGQSLHIDSVDYQVRGIVPDASPNSSFQYKAFLPISALLTNPKIRANDENWDNANYITFVKLAPGVNMERATRKINDVIKLKGKASDNVPVSMISLSDMHFETEIQNSVFNHGNKNTVLIISLIGGLLLLIACINYVNLSTAKAGLRAKEVSIRKITGASRSDLFTQFIGESFLTSLVAAVITLILVRFFLPLFNELTGKDFDFRYSLPILLQVSGVTLISSFILNSIYPALLLSSFSPINVFRGVTILKVKDNTFRKGLVIIQFIVSVILIAATLVIYKQMQFIQQKDLGYSKSQVVSFALPFTINRDRKNALLKTMKQELLAQSAVQSVTTSNQPLVNMGSACSGCADWAGRDTSLRPTIAQLSVDEDFQKTMDLKMQSGRWFNRNTSDKHNVVLNETALKTLSIREPAIGQQFVFKGDTGQIIGIAKDFTFKSMHDKIGPLVIFNNADWRSYFAVRISGNHTREALAAVETVWKKNLPEVPLEYSFLDEQFSELYTEDTRTSHLTLIFACIAIVISSLGVFSLVAFEVEHRTKEIGIRKILGAPIKGIVSMLSADFVKLVFISILVASPIAWWVMNKWIQNFVYRIPINWWMFAIAGVIAMLITLITISFQAIKAAMANPVKSLRTE